MIRLTTFLKVLKNSISSPYFRNEYLKLILHRCFSKSPAYSNYSFLDAGQTLEYLSRNKKSFVRFGDGEFAILYGFDIYFQRYDPLLKDLLLEIIESYTPDSPYLLGVPPIPIKNLDYSYMQKSKNLKYWTRAEAFMKTRLSKRCVYGDLFIFRRAAYSRMEVPKLWGNKIVVLVGSMTKYFTDKQLEGAKDQYLVDCPLVNAFEEWEGINRNILEVITTNHLKNEELVILISLGPAAKVIAYELSKRPLVVYDVGHYFDLRSQK